MVDMVSRQDHDLVAFGRHDEGYILSHGVRGSPVPIPVLLSRLGGKDLDTSGASRQVPGGAIPYMVHERKRFVLCQDGHAGHFRIADVAEGKVDYPVNSAEGDGWFRPVPYQDVEPASHPACQKDRCRTFHWTTSPRAYSFFEKESALSLGWTVTPPRMDTPSGITVPIPMTARSLPASPIRHLSDITQPVSAMVRLISVPRGRLNRKRGWSPRQRRPPPPSHPGRGWSAPHVP